MTHRTSKKDWRDSFIEALSLTGNVKFSCATAGISRAAVYEERKHNTGFAASWASALEDANDVLEQEAQRRAVHGTVEPVTSGGKVVMVEDENGNRVPLTVRKYSDTLLIFLMKGNNPRKYRDNYKPPEPEPGFDLYADVEAMTPDEREIYRIKVQQYIARLRAAGILTTQ